MYRKIFLIIIVLLFFVSTADSFQEPNTGVIKEVTSEKDCVEIYKKSEEIKASIKNGNMTLTGNTTNLKASYMNKEYKNINNSTKIKLKRSRLPGEKVKVYVTPLFYRNSTKIVPSSRKNQIITSGYSVVTPKGFVKSTVKHGCHSISIVSPNNVPNYGSEKHALDLLKVSRKLDVGHRRERVVGVMLSERPDLNGIALENSFLYCSDLLSFNVGNIYTHEYIHTRQRGGLKDKYSEGSAVYLSSKHSGKDWHMEFVGHVSSNHSPVFEAVFSEQKINTYYDSAYLLAHQNKSVEKILRKHNKGVNVTSQVSHENPPKKFGLFIPTSIKGIVFIFNMYPITITVLLSSIIIFVGERRR